VAAVKDQNQHCIRFVIPLPSFLRFYCFQVTMFPIKGKVIAILSFIISVSAMPIFEIRSVSGLKRPLSHIVIYGLMDE
jgi:hypothetical protein